MHPPDSAGPSTARMLIALAVFAAAVLGGVLLVVGPPHSSKEKVNNSENMNSVAAPKKEAEGDEAAFFYDAVGRAPQDLSGDSGEKQPGAKASYTLEIKVTSSREDAEQVIDDLHEQGVEAYYTPMTRAGKVVYRVRRGIFPSQRAADRAAVAMRQAQKVAAKVVKLQ